MSPHKLTNYGWKIVTVNQPVMFHRTEDEVWLLNPARRYVLNAMHVTLIQDFVETVSDLNSGSLLNHLSAGKNIADTRVLIERLRDRGIGDLLFLTGPLAFLNHVTGHNVKLDVYALSDRAVILTHNPDISNGTALCGPVEYDHLRLYNFHWFVESVTECDEEVDQLNVYDALYRQLNFDPDQIDAQWKRPKAVTTPEDFRHLDRLYKMVYDQKKIDLRRTGYYVVAPFAAASIRSLSYVTWLAIIKELSARRPVVVVGSTKMKLPDTEMSAGSFVHHVANTQMPGPVINMIDGTPLRVLMALIERAKALVCLDSGTLYIAEALRTPAISLWGSHHPGVRLGYDPDYMDLAIWNSTACDHSPCFAYVNFPENKCPRGRGQVQCEVLGSTTPDDVLKKLDAVESASVKLAPFTPK